MGGATEAEIENWWSGAWLVVVVSLLFLPGGDGGATDSSNRRSSEEIHAGEASSPIIVAISDPKALKTLTIKLKLFVNFL